VTQREMRTPMAPIFTMSRAEAFAAKSRGDRRSAQSPTCFS
jgi:hypothetical protein